MIRGELAKNESFKLEYVERLVLNASSSMVRIYDNMCKRLACASSGRQTTHPVFLAKATPLYVVERGKIIADDQG